MTLSGVNYVVLHKKLINCAFFRTGSDTGRLLENMVAVEWYRRGDEFFSFKSAGGKEVDVVVRTTSGGFSLFQVRYDLSDQKTRKREFVALAKAAEEGAKTVGTYKIHLVLVWKWLLNR